MGRMALRPAWLLGAVLLLAMLAMFAGAAAMAGGPQGTGTIAGVVIMDDPPAPSTLEANADQAVCGETVPNEEIVATDVGQVADAVIRVTGVPWPDGVPSPKIDNIGCRFVPHVQIAPTRSQLLVTSQDETLHSTHAYDDRQRTDFNIAMPFPGMEINRPLRRPGVVRIACDSHLWMRGWVVVSNDIGAVSGADGSFTIEGVPAGEHELTIWHEVLGAQPLTVTVTAGATTEVELTLVRQ
jgi:hypothetical protein